MEDDAHAASFGRAMMHLPNVNYLQAATLLSTLAECGIRHAAISPGSRSTPLAVVAANDPRYQSFVLYDERSAGFFALGLARATGLPVTLICTSGTATANYYPALIEASQSCVPLMVLTADRPRRLRHSGAPQTIDQLNLYAGYPRWFLDLEEPQLSLDCMQRVRESAQMAFSNATREPRGPVHINVPLDEPLAPIPHLESAVAEVWTALTTESTIVSNPSHSSTVEEAIVHSLANAISESQCGLIVAGPYAATNENEALALHRLARRLGWPLLADIGSGVRFFSLPVVPYYDIWLGCEPLAALSPDLVLAFGAYPTSRTLNEYLDRHRNAHTIRIQPHAMPRDPSRRASQTIVCDLSALIAELVNRVTATRDSLLLEPFMRAGGLVESGLADVEATVAHDSDALAVRTALRMLPDASALVVANSLPIRHAEALGSANGARITTYVMRGANGIDGTVSHAAGIAAVHDHTLLISGDLALLHDLNGLFAARRFARRLTILLINNNGGGIFHHLPVHDHENQELFELIHGTPHSLKLSAAGELFGIEWRRVSGAQAIEAALQKDFDGVRVIEISFDRTASAAAHRDLIARLKNKVS